MPLSPVWIVLLIGLTLCQSVSGQISDYTLQNQMIISGKLGRLSGVAENPLAAQASTEVSVQPIIFADDGLRRTYVSKYQLILESLRQSEPRRGREGIKIPQRVATTGSRRVASIVSIRDIGAFDKFGRRTFTLGTPDGDVTLIQGITEITPRYTRLQSLTGPVLIEWDSRIATSSIPRETLSMVLRNRPDADTANGRLDVVRLLFESDRYRDAQDELEQAMQEFPELEQRDELLQQLKQRAAQQLIDEIKLRQQAGQHQRAFALLNGFPADGVAGEVLEQVRSFLEDYRVRVADAKAIQEQIAKLVDGVADGPMKNLANVFADELKNDLSLENVNRLIDYVRLADDPAMPNDQKLSLAISGWVMGPGEAINNLAISISLLRVRDLVRAYLQTEIPNQRHEILLRIREQEGALPAYVAKIIANMTPPIPVVPQEGRSPGNFVFQIPGLESDTIEYEVQLPDEYSPYRRYPTVISLHGAGGSPSQQIAWWAGRYNEQWAGNTGQAARRGYIVIAPHWARTGQANYEYTAWEHAAVLKSLRDAARRFAIDTDRVFLSGFSMGGDAAWDIGLAHPHLWAGIIPICGVSDWGGNAPKYVTQYADHAKFTSLYLVMGELDGNKRELNATNLDRYFSRTGYDAMAIEYLGRGHESNQFYEEIHSIFEWMDKHQRKFVQPEFEVATLRTFDNVFWCLEFDKFPPDRLIHPLEWPAKNSRPTTSSFRMGANQSISVNTAAADATLWLSPEWIDFNERIALSVGSRPRETVTLAGSLDDMLEDARTRVDRQHVFWLKVPLNTGRRK